MLQEFQEIDFTCISSQKTFLAQKLVHSVLLNALTRFCLKIDILGSRAKNVFFYPTNELFLVKYIFKEYRASGRATRGRPSLLLSIYP